MISKPESLPPTLAECREELDRLDRELVRLIGQRIEVGYSAAVIKREAGMSVADPDREQKVLAQAEEWAREAGLPVAEVSEIFHRIVSLSRNAQLNAKPNPTDEH